MDAIEISSDYSRENQEEILNQIASGSKYIIVEKEEKAAALVSVQYLELLESVLDSIENIQDIKDSSNALKESNFKGTKSLAQVVGEMGLDI